MGYTVLLKLLKNKWTWIILGFIILLLAVIILSAKVSNLRIDNQRMTENYNITNTELIMVKDENGKLSSKQQELNLTYEETLQLKDERISELLTVIEKRKDIKPKNLDRISVVEFEVKDTIKNVIPTRDSINPQIIMMSFDDGFLSSNITFNERDWIADQEYIYTDEESEICYYSRSPLKLFKKEIKWLKWGKKEYWVEKSFKNPATKITYSSVIKVYKNKKAYRNAQK